MRYFILNTFIFGGEKLESDMVSQNIHGISYDDMLNGEGLRAVIWFSGCGHKCPNCHNPQTWNKDSGRRFQYKKDYIELLEYLKKDYVNGVTFSGGDPLYENSITFVTELAKSLKERINTNIWVYTGYRWGEITKDPLKSKILEYIDVLVDGKFEQDKYDINYPFAGSTNQRVIDVKKTLSLGEIVLYNLS